MAKKAKKKKRAAKKNPTRALKSGKTVSLDRERRKVKALETQIANMKRRARATAARRREETKARKKNPKRPPHAWWTRCLSSVEAKKYARDPAAVCSAAWWRMSRAQRGRIVRRMQRSAKRRDRRVAVALAKAERNRASRAARRRNPGSADARALAEYKRTHWGKTGDGRVSQGVAGNPAHGTLTKMGTLVEVAYETEKGGDHGLVEYEHAFEGQRPTLAYNEKGRLIIVDGTYTVKTGGIVG